MLPCSAFRRTRVAQIMGKTGEREADPPVCSAVSFYVFTRTHLYTGVSPPGIPYESSMYSNNTLTIHDCPILPLPTHSLLASVLPYLVVDATLP